MSYDSQTIENVTTEEVLEDYEGWDEEVTGLLGAIKQPRKWSINIVYPSLESYARGRVALLGDAVSESVGHVQLDGSLRYAFDQLTIRHTQCCHIWEQVQNKALKTRRC